MNSSLSYRLVAFLILLLLCTLLWSGQYLRRGLWEPDEARYTYVAQEMDEAGSWFMPLRNGDPYAHKPPLMFWLIKAGTLATAGEFNNISGRLPSLLGALLALSSLLAIGTAWFDRKTGWWAVLFLLTSYLFWGKGGMGQIDMLLLGLEMTALFLLFSAEDNPTRWRYVGAFSLMGLAVLAKGPVGLIVPVGIYFSTCLINGEPRKLLAWHWLWGLGLALLFPLCWLLLAKLNGAPSSYFDELLFKQNLDRFAGKFGGHVRPFYYYLQYLPLDFLPWTFLVPGSLLLLLKQPEKRKQVKTLLAWILFVVVFFSLSSSKRNLYIFAVYPAASLLVAASLPRLKTLSRRWQLGSFIPFLLLFGLLGTALLVAPWFINLPTSKLIYPPLGFSLLIGLALLYREFRGKGLAERWAYLAIGFIFLVEMYVGTIVLPAFNPVKTPLQLAAAAQRVVPETQPLFLYRMNGEIFALYSRRQGRKVTSEAELLDEIDATERGVVVFSAHDCEKVKNRFSDRGVFYPFSMGSKQMCWLEYNHSLNQAKTFIPATEDKPVVQ